jgi:hypothetical protein
MAAVMITVIIVIGASLYAQVQADKRSGTAGFQSSDLVSPEATLAELPEVEIPGNLTLVPIKAGSFNLFWNITEDVYAGYGGALQLSIENKNAGTLYVYGFGLRWIDDSTTFMRNSSVIVPPGQRADLGLLTFGAPPAGQEKYQIVVESAVSNPAGTLWYDAGTINSTSNTAYIKALGTDHHPTVTRNVVVHYNRINEAIDQDAVSAVVENIKALYPDGYSLLQVAEAYEWVLDNVEYVPETTGDHWQSASETMGLGEGDCEDHAILLCSIIEGLGGSSRVNIIEEHAFPSVYIGSTRADLMNAERSIASYYGLDASEFQLTYLEDDDGYWMVVDTTGFPYAGGLPANSEPTSASGSWTVLSDYLIQIDATGQTSDSVFHLF